MFDMTFSWVHWYFASAGFPLVYHFSSRVAINTSAPRPEFELFKLLDVCSNLIFECGFRFNLCNIWVQQQDFRETDRLEGDYRGIDTTVQIKA